MNRLGLFSLTSIVLLGGVTSAQAHEFFASELIRADLQRQCPGTQEKASDECALYRRVCRQLLRTKPGEPGGPYPHDEQDRALCQTILPPTPPAPKVDFGTKEWQETLEYCEPFSARAGDAEMGLPNGTLAGWNTPTAAHPCCRWAVPCPRLR
ncbi:MAG: hypothetical protein AB7F66_01155 [Bacteriovoracia bacterium]